MISKIREIANIRDNFKATRPSLFEASDFPTHYTGGSSRQSTNRRRSTQKLTFSKKYPKIGNDCAHVSRIPRCGNSRRVHFSYKEICWKPHRKSAFPASFPKIGNYCVPFLGSPFLENEGHFHVYYWSVGNSKISKKMSISFLKLDFLIYCSREKVFSLGLRHNS